MQEPLPCSMRNQERIRDVKVGRFRVAGGRELKLEALNVCGHGTKDLELDVGLGARLVDIGAGHDLARLLDTKERARCIRVYHDQPAVWSLPNVVAHQAARERSVERCDVVGGVRSTYAFICANRIILCRGMLKLWRVWPQLPQCVRTSQ